MAADYFTIDRSKQLGNQAVRAASLVNELQGLLAQLNEIASHSWDTGDYTVLEANFGLATGKGADFLSLLGAINTLFNTNTDVSGQTRLDQLNGFVARVSGQ